MSRLTGGDGAGDASSRGVMEEGESSALARPMKGMLVGMEGAESAARLLLSQ